MQRTSTQPGALPKSTSQPSRILCAGNWPPRPNPGLSHGLRFSSQHNSSAYCPAFADVPVFPTPVSTASSRFVRYHGRTRSASSRPLPHGWAASGSFRSPPSATPATTRMMPVPTACSRGVAERRRRGVLWYRSSSHLSRQDRKPVGHHGIRCNMSIMNDV